MIRFLQIVFFFICTATNICAQAGSLWEKIEPADFDTDLLRQIRPMPSSYTLYNLDQEEFLSELGTHQVIEFPLPGGGSHPFIIGQVTNFHPTLARKFQYIRSYAGETTGSEPYRLRFSVTPESISASMQTPDGEVYIDPLNYENGIYYIVYYTRDFLPSPEVLDRMRSHTHHFEGGSFPDFQLPPNSPFARKRSNPVELRRYDLALSCTGEYAQRHGGTVLGALAAINVALDRINFLLEAEVAITLRLIADNDKLIFLDAATDPFTNGNAGQMALENNNYLMATLPSSAYDVGHVFGTLCSNVVGTSGGIGTVCGSTKGYGSSCEISTSDRFYIGIVCHELGHQFGARHTWNHCPTVSENQFNAGTAFEPGSGTTLMAYAGACGNQNVQFMEDHYFHNNSIAAIAAFSRLGSGNSCAEIIQTENMAPEVEIVHPDGLTIPVSTPFELTCQGSDPDGDIITYSWEQYDPGIGQAGMTPLGMPVGNAPIFRSVRPSVSPSRTFPSLSKILANQFDDTEVLPTYTRDLTFRVTARDGRAGGGGVSWDEIRLKSTASAGPFRVLSFDDSTTVSGGSYMEIKWDVANTDQAPVSCQTVHVYLSTNGGRTFPILLAENSPNDGSVMVTIPDVSSDSARIKVQAADNVFFGISEKNFTISRPDVPTAILDIKPNELFVCLPESRDIILSSASISGFADSIRLVVNAPQEISVSIQNPIIFPGDSSIITLDFDPLAESGLYDLDVYGITSTGDTLLRHIRITATSNDFSDLSLLTPGGSGVAQRPSFFWQAAKNATAYVLEISSDPAFINGVLRTGMTSQPEMTLDTLLNENTLYFWRITPYNACGSGSPTAPKAFHTVNLLCELFNGSGLPQPLSQSTTPTVASEVFVEEAGLISDVNIPEITGFHEAFNNLTFILQGPDSSRVTLIRGQCGFSSRQFTLGFDDQSPNPFDCRVSFRGQIFQPGGSLEIFNGLERAGIWTLLVKDTLIGGGGQIEKWTLELCGSVEVTPPELVVNDGLIVEQNMTAILLQEELEVSSGLVGADQLYYRLVRTPDKGQLFLLDQVLAAGDRFTQGDINSGSVSYVHQSNDTLPDQFDFVVQDEQGGWIDITTFRIMVRSSTVDIEQPVLSGLLSVFPNPNRGEVYLDSRIPGEIWLIQMDGKVMNRSEIVPGTNYRDWTSLPSGLYVIRFRGAGHYGTWRFVIVK